MKYLGLDLGERKTGVAVSDENGCVTKALPVLRHKNWTQLLTKLQDLAKREKVAKIVVGQAKSWDNQLTARSVQIQDFAQRLGQELQLEVLFWDEAFSSQQAQAVLAGGKKKTEDSEAASIILSEFLHWQNEQEKHTKNN